MPNYCISPVGSDTSGDGSSSAPWASLSKALQAIPDAPCTLQMAAGVYAENSSSLGYLYLNRAFTSPVVIEPDTEGASVIVTEAKTVPALYTVRLSGAANLTFRSLTFRMRNTNSKALIFFQSGSIHDVTFEGCVIEPLAVAAVGGSVQNASVRRVSFRYCQMRPQANRIGVVSAVLIPVGAGGVLDLSLDHCTMESAGDTLSLFVFMTDASGIVSVTLTDSTVLSAGGGGVQVRGGALHIERSTVSAYRIAVVLGINGVPTYRSYGHVLDSSIVSSTGHALLIGGCVGVLARGNVVIGGDQALVVKESADCVAEDNQITGGTLSGLYFKASQHCAGLRNRITSITGVCMQVLSNPSDDSKPSGSIVLTDNSAEAQAAAVCLRWGDAMQDSGGGVCDRNRYCGNLGTVRGVAAASLDALQAAWTGYDVPNNDAQSNWAACPVEGVV